MLIAGLWMPFEICAFNDGSNNNRNPSTTFLSFFQIVSETEEHCSGDGTGGVRKRF